QYFPWHDSSFIDVVEGMENLSVPNGRERHRLKHRCPTYRLASEAHVYGDVVIKTQPCESALQDNG
ncbi:MAG: hypothetical protein JO317_09485, partial [Verrucomicrobiae bacterium]|nr:hypothetical protein [Verrucomicrobiae bacterium]